MNRTTFQFLNHVSRIQVDEDGIAIERTQGKGEPCIDERVGEREHLCINSTLFSIAQRIAATYGENDADRKQGGPCARAQRDDQ